MSDPLDTAGILWVAALDRVPIEERVAWVEAMQERVAEINAKRAPEGATAPSPTLLYKRTGGGAAYRVAMLEHGYVDPTPPGPHRDSGKRVLQCGLVHEFDWSEWRRYRVGGYEFEGRFCRTCATTQVREIEADRG